MLPSSTPGPARDGTAVSTHRLTATPTNTDGNTRPPRYPEDSDQLVATSLISAMPARAQAP